MDNITHSLIGAAVGDWIYKKEKVPSTSSKDQRRLWIVASIIGNNFPDLDVLYTKITPSPLGSLLHHRGHTHTLVGLIPQWLLIIGLLWILRKPLRFDQLTKRDWKMAAVISALGLALHIFADFWNTYGIHPFFPFSYSWFYGDAIFIIEPFLWALLGGSLLATGVTILRFLPFILLCSLLVFGVRNDYLGVVSVAVAATIFTGVYLIRRQLKHRWPAFALTALLAMIGTSFFTSRYLRAELTASAPTTHRVLDVALHPAPASPFCWFVIRVAVTKQEYEVHRGVVSLFPNLLPTEECKTLGRISSKVLERSFLGSMEVIWSEAYITSLKKFEILKENCSARAWM
ncbi:MAG: metal-dependent hydrolase, partial [Bdellovibrionales bacterium]